MSNENYGLNFNYSLATDGDDIRMGVHVTDSNGVNVSSEVETQDIEEGFRTLVDKILSGIFNHSADQQEEEDVDLDAMIAALEHDNMILENRVKDLQKKIISYTANNTLLEKRLEDLQNKLNPTKDQKEPNISVRCKTEARSGLDLELMHLLKFFM